MRIFVGNLSFSATGEDIRKAFLAFGSVSSVDIKMKNKKAQSRGFGFVEMPNEQEAQAAMAGLQGKELLGRPLNISPARIQERPERFMPEADKIIPDNKSEVRKYPRKYDDRKKYFGAKPRRNEPRPWQKRSGESKPWQKHSGEPKPWQKTAEESKPWQKRSGESRPWQKRSGESKPWQKRSSESKPWQKRSGESKPRQKRSSEHKPWQKSKGRSQIAGKQHRSGS